MKRKIESWAAFIPSLQSLSRHPFHGALKWNPSGIPAAVVFDHGALVSTGFPSRQSLGGDPTPPANFALNPAIPSSDEELSAVRPSCFRRREGTPPLRLIVPIG